MTNFPYARTAILILFLVLTTCTAQVLLSKGMKQLGEFKLSGVKDALRFAGRVMTNPYTWSGFLLECLSFFSWLAILTYLPLSFALPFTALNYIGAAFLAKLVLHEPIPFLRWMGVFLIAAGVVMTALTVKAGEPIRVEPAPLALPPPPSAPETVAEAVAKAEAAEAEKPPG